MISNQSKDRGNDWRKRLDGLVPEQIDSKRILIIGCGSVGSFMASELVRTGIRHMTLIDHDIVEWPNLTRTVYTASDVGSLKVEALDMHLRTIFPDLNIKTYGIGIQTVGAFNTWSLSEEFVNEFKSADLIIAAADQPKASGLINRYSYMYGKTVVYPGLYKGAKGGEVVTVVPGKTPCYHCSTGNVRREISESQGVARVLNYGTNRLEGEIALGSDIHFVCSAANKIVLSLLSQDHPDLPLAKFMGKIIDTGSTYLTLGMEPDYYLFPALHKNVPGQYAFQSAWIKPSFSSDCEICGSGLSHS